MEKINFVKPIFIVKLSYTMYAITSDEIEKLRILLKRQLEDYHVLVVSCGVEDIQFQCFYEKDFNEVKYDELKEIVKNFNKNKDGQ